MEIEREEERKFRLELLMWMKQHTPSQIDVDGELLRSMEKLIQTYQDVNETQPTIIASAVSEGGVEIAASDSTTPSEWLYASIGEAAHSLPEEIDRIKHQDSLIPNLGDDRSFEGSSSDLICTTGGINVSSGGAVKLTPKDEEEDTLGNSCGEGGIYDVDFCVGRGGHKRAREVMNIFSAPYPNFYPVQVWKPGSNMDPRVLSQQTQIFNSFVTAQGTLVGPGRGSPIGLSHGTSYGLL